MQIQVGLQGSQYTFLGGGGIGAPLRGLHEAEGKAEVIAHKVCVSDAAGHKEVSEWHFQKFKQVWRISGLWY